MKKRILLLFLVGVMLLLPLMGCKKSEDTNKPTQIGDVGEKYDSDGYLMDDLPADLRFDDADIRVLHWTEADILEFNPSESTVVVTERAIWERDRRVEERLGVFFEWIPTKGHWQSETNFLNTVQTAMDSGDTSAYDIIATYSQSAALISTRGLVKDVKDNPYLDLKKPWWPEALTETFTISDDLYFLSGDLSTTFLSQMIGVYFNKEFFPDQDLYQLVYDGDWTFDKMLEFAKGVGSDVDNEYGKTKGDRYGVVVPWEIYLDGFFYGCDMIMVDKDTNGALRVNSSYVGERADTVAEKLKTLFHDSIDGWFTNEGSPIEAFAGGRAAFMVAPGVALLNVTDVRDSKVDYGVLPMPKYDTAQEEYKTVCTNLTSLYSIFAAKSKAEADRAGAVLECMASEGHRRIAPVVFNTCLQLRYAKDGDTGKMFDLIREGVAFDIGRVYSRSALDDITQRDWQRCVIDGNKVWAAQTATIDAKLQALLDNLQALFDARD